MPYPPQRRARWRERGYALLLVLLACLPRLTHLDLAEFKLDEANHYRMAYELLRGSWRWAGSTASVGIPKPPLFIYVISLPLALTRDPRFAVGILGLLGALGVGLFYLTLRRTLSRRATLAGALLLALNPHAVLYSRKLFTADLLPPLGALLFAAGVAYLKAPRKGVLRHATLVSLAFAALLLTTFSPALLLPALAVLLWERREELTPRQWLVVGAALALPFVPYLLAVAPSLPALVMPVGEGAGAAGSPPLTEWSWTLLFGAPWPTFPTGPVSFLAVGLAALTLVGALNLTRQATRGESRGWARFVLAWVFGALLMALVLPVEVKAHYLVVLYPALFALPAAGVEALGRREAWGNLALLLVLAVAAWQAHAWSETLEEVRAGVEGYGTPLGYWREAAEGARRLVRETDAEEVLVVVPGDAAWDEPANALDALLVDTPHRLVDGQYVAVLPAHPAALLFAPGTEGTAELLKECTEEARPPLPASPFGGTFTYRAWAPSEAEPWNCAPNLGEASARWASGAELLGYAVEGTPEPEGTLVVILLWQTPTGARESALHWFVHLLDAEEHNRGQHDTPGWPARRWQPGDHVLLVLELPHDAEEPLPPYALRVGQYTYPEMENVPVVDEAGNPADYATLLPLPR